jgi:hypothetical protein
MLQSSIVVALVLGSLCYAGWTLMPAALRRTLALALLKWPLPEAVALRLRKAAQGASGCGCDGCDHAPAKKAAADAAKPLIFHPRVPR